MLLAWGCCPRTRVRTCAAIWHLPGPSRGRTRRSPTQTLSASYKILVNVWQTGACRRAQASALKRTLQSTVRQRARPQRNRYCPLVDNMNVPWRAAVSLWNWAAAARGRTRRPPRPRTRPACSSALGRTPSHCSPVTSNCMELVPVTQVHAIYIACDCELRLSMRSGVLTRCPLRWSQRQPALHVPS